MADVFVATLLKLLPDFFRISASIIMLVGPLFSLLQPPGTTSIGLSISTITKSAFSHQRVAAKTTKSPTPCCCWIGAHIYHILFEVYIIPYCVYCLYVFQTFTHSLNRLRQLSTLLWSYLKGPKITSKLRNFQLGSSEILLKYLPFLCNCSKKQTYSKCISMGFIFILQKFPRVRPVEATAGHPESFYLNLTTWTTLYKKRVFQTTPFGGNFYGSLNHTHFVYIALVRQSLM